MCEVRGMVARDDAKEGTMTIRILIQTQRTLRKKYYPRARPQTAVSLDPFVSMDLLASLG